MFSKTVASEKILLRPYEAGDISSWRKWDVDSAVQKFLPEPKNLPMSEDAGLKYLKECEREIDGYYFSIVWKENNKLIGTISITEINTYHGIGELGIVIGEKEFWGKGVATEAIKMILDLAPSLGLRRIAAEFEEGNIGMEKALVGSGFQKESNPISSRIKNGKPINTVRYFVLLDWVK